MAIFSTGLSALTASQRVLDIIGENIANASTPGYHRQVANLVESAPNVLGGLAIGTGVQVEDITRQRSAYLDQALNQQASAAADATTQLTALQQVQAFLAPGQGSVADSLNTFFNGLDQLAANPDDVAQRQVVVSNAGALADQLNTLSGQLDAQHGSLDSQIDAVLKEVNTRTSKIADLNGQIQRQIFQGIQPNDLMDQRDQLVNEVAQRLGIRTVELPDGQTTVLAGGGMLVGGNVAVPLVKTTDSAGNVVIAAGGAQTPLDVSGGQLAGLLQVRNQFLPAYQSRLDALAKQLIQGMDGLQATGLGLSGPMTFLAGQRSAASSTLPLDKANLAFPPTAGSLFITVTDKSTGRQSLSEIAIDPAVQSLQSLAAAISGVSHVNAVVDPQTNTLEILAQPGFAFDFTGRLQTSPDTAGITGTTVPQIGGVYTGAANDSYSFRVVGTGTIGVTPGLTLQVVNSSNAPIASLNIGQGYSPGTVLQVANGVTVQLGAGTANAGDTFTSKVVAQPDTAGILPALGLKSFFSGQSARDIGVQPGLLAAPSQLAASRTGQPGDGSVLLQMAGLRDRKVLGNGSQTLNDGYAAMIGDIGAQVQQLGQQNSSLTALGQSLQANRQGVSGVDPNQELVAMLQFQRSFQMAARYVTAVNSSLDDLLKII
jgi:flagellar hook-associated protein FlgK